MTIEESMQEEINRLSKKILELHNENDNLTRLAIDAESERDTMKEQCVEQNGEIEQLRADLAKMKSTLSDTQQTLRAVQEDRDEFAAKMNDAVEMAEALQSRCTDLESICAAKKREISDLLAEKVSLLQESCQLKVECGELKEELEKAKQDVADLESLKKIIAGFGEAFRFVVEHWRGGGT